MKLELKHIAPYLPYGLKIFVECDSEFDTNGFDPEFDENPVLISGVREMTGINYENSFLPDCIMFKEVPKTNYSRDGYVHLENIKPILRPLSCFSEFKYNEISTFTYNSKDKQFRSSGYSSRYYSDIEFYPCCLINYLFENHFDLFNLIEAGLAIDINTLNK